MNLIVLIIVAFILGSIPVGYLVSKAKGLDIRKTGSGNIGATNVLRSIGKKEALITLLGDLAKGIIPVLLAWGVFPDNAFKVGIVGLSAIGGHDFSLFLRFKGGKGVATSLGVLIAYSPIIALVTLGLWIMVFAFTKYSSLSALVSFLLLPLNTFLMDNSGAKVFISFLITVLLFYRHKDNIKRLIRGEESRAGKVA